MKLDKDEKRILSEEQAAAEAFLCARLKPKGAIQYIKDGKTDLYAKVKWPDLVKLLWNHAIERCALRAQQAIDARKKEGQ